MGKSHENKDQYSLFDIPAQQAEPDYSRQRGGEYPFAVANSGPSEPEVDGVSVSLQERHETLEKAASMYARHARATGLGKAALNPEERPRLDKRYGGAAQTENLVRNTNKKASFTFASSEIDLNRPTDEQRMLEGVLKTRELVRAGFDPVDVETSTQEMIVGIRHAIGRNVGQQTRNANVRRAERTARNAQRLR